MAWSEFREGVSRAQRARTTGKEDPTGSSLRCGTLDLIA
jgi:hypothetical protein